MEQRTEPYVVHEEPGLKKYCSCGLSKNKPYCDGSHHGTGMHSYKVQIDEPKTVAICGCGLSSTKPFCDGSHQSLKKT